MTPRLCSCGCGKPVTSTHPRARFASPYHKDKAYERRKRAREIAARPERRCECGCNRPLSKTFPRRKYATQACAWREESRRKRAKRHEGKPPRHPRTSDLWELRAEMDREGGKGLCIFCPKKLGPKRRLICGSEKCTRAYHELYDVAKRAERAEKRRSVVSTPQ